MSLDERLTQEDVELLFESHLPKIADYCAKHDIYDLDVYAVAQVHRLALMHDNGFAASPEEFMGFLSMAPDMVAQICAANRDQPEFAGALANMVQDTEYADFVFEMYHLEIRPYLLESGD